jgi:hypothetical protein
MAAAMSQFQIKIPDGWEDQTIYTYKGPDDSGVQHMMTLVVDLYVNASTAEEFARPRIDTAMATLQGAEILKEDAKQLASGFPAYECVYKWVPSGADARFVKTVYILVDGVGYVFSGNFSKKTIKTIGTEMDQMIESFRPLGGKQQAER